MEYIAMNCANQYNVFRPRLLAVFSAPDVNLTRLDVQKGGDDIASPL
eukprot:SAG22_NODE_3588_length_1629_cov_3.615162_1_plen_47_part_10